MRAPDTDLVRHHRSSGLRYRVSTDARGDRVDAPGVETPNDVGLLAVGGSYAWGHGVENRETFTSLLGGS